MKKFITKSFAVFGLLALLSIISFGQETTQKPETENKVTPTVKIGVPLPKAVFPEGIDGAQAAAGIREMIGGYFKGTHVEIVAIEARLPQAIVAEALEKGCAFVLQTAITQKKGGSGFAIFKSIAPALGNVVPMAGRAGQVAGTVARTAIMTAANMSANTRSKDQFTFEYSLLSTADNTVKAAETIKAKAKSDGEDVLSPMIEKMAEKVVTSGK